MNNLLNVLSALLLFIAWPVNAVENLSQINNKANKVYQSERSHSANRVELTQEQKNQLLNKKAELEKFLTALKIENQNLSQKFNENEHLLSEKEKELQIETGSLGELFGVVRQSAKEAKQEYQNTFITNVDTELSVIERVINTEALPSLNLLEQFWKVTKYKIDASSQLSYVDVPFVHGDGSQSKESAVRVGDMALIAQKGHIKWDNQDKFATDYQSLPKNGSKTSQINVGSSVLLDPTRGVLLQQFANQPNLQQRIEQGGVVGKIIITLLGVGLLIALYRGLVLLVIQAKISRQLKKPDQVGNNPLGRVLKAFENDRHQSIDSLELRLLERILDEQHGLERGLSMLKLMAALAPMLGLLGTVTGMIETFQVITQFGNSDPKVMAGGISMALVTTVMGLVAAMPLLLAHNLLSSRAEAIKSTLEKQGVSLVARRAESEHMAEVI